jgi:hypothetical protein
MVYEKPTAPRSIGGVLDDGLSLWREALPKTWVLAVVSQLILAIPTLLFRSQATDTVATQDLNQRLMLMMGQTARLSLVFYGLLLVSYIFRNAIMLRIAAVADGADLDIGESLSTGTRLMLRVIGLFLLLGVGIVIMAVVVGVAAGFMSAASGAGARITGIAIACLAVGLVLFVGIRVLLAYVAMVVEDRPVFESVKLSWNLTRGYWWRTTAILTVLGIIALVLAAVLYFLIGVVISALGMLSFATAVIVQLASVVAYAFLGSLSPAVLLAIFHDLKLRNEGADLAGRVNALASK